MSKIEIQFHSSKRSPLADSISAMIHQEPGALAGVLIARKGQSDGRRILKYTYSIPEWAIWRSKTVRFSLRDGPFRVPKRTILEREKTVISKLLIIIAIQRRLRKQEDMIYFCIILSVLSCRSVLSQK